MDWATLGDFFHKLIWSPWDRCYDFKNILGEKFSEKIGVFDSELRQILIITLVLKKNAIFSQKTGENCRKFVIITSTPGPT
jgi:hypothetical protein